MYKNKKGGQKSLIAPKENNITKYQFYLIIGIIIIIASLATMQTANAADVYVNTTGNDGTGTGTIDSPYKTISWGISRASSGDTVNLGAGTFSTYTNTTHRDYNITISKNLNIKGAGTDQTIINATEKGWIFNIQSGYTVTISNLTITNGTRANDGGAIQNNGVLTVNNCKFTSNKATGDNGGAIYNTGTLNVDGSTFTSNTAYNGGAIYNTGTLNVTSTTFASNTATNNGGAIWNDDTLYVTGNNLVDNSATTSGGAIYNTNNGSTAEIHFNRIIGNTAPTGSQIRRNRGTLNANNNWWGSNVGPTGISGTTVTTWLNLTISASPTSIPTSGTSTVTADLTHDNTGVYHDPASGHVPDEISVSFNSNLGTIDPSATILNGQVTSILTGSTPGLATVNAIVDSQTVNTQITISRTDVYVSPTGSDNTGDGSQGNPYQSISKGITMVYTGGTVHIANGTYKGANNWYITINKNVAIIGASRDSTIIDAQKLNRIFTIQSGAIVTISNLTIANGTSTNGGAIYNDGTLTLTGVNLLNNTATNGGAIYNTGTLTITSSNLLNNSATAGGALYNTGTATLNFNRITGTSNVIASSGHVNAENNWWGSNADPSGKVSGDVDVGPWLVLRVSASQTGIPVNGVSTITADLTHNSDGEDTSSQRSLPNGIIVNFLSDVLGTVNPASSQTVNGRASATYTAGTTPGNSTVRGTVDSQTQLINVIIGNVSIYMRNYLSYNRATPWDCNNAPRFVVDVRNTNSNGSITGLVDATNVIIEFILPNGLEYEGHSTRGVGTAIYDPLTRKITWTIDKLPAGGIAFMNVLTRIVKTGSLSTTARFVSVDQYNLGTAPTQAVRAITVSPTSADIQVTQTITDHPTIPNQKVITITTKNNGPDTATGVRVTDLLPTGLVFDSKTLTMGDYNEISGLWTIGNLLNNETCTLTIYANLTTSSPVQNTVNKTNVDQYDWNFDNNAQTITLNPINNGNVSIYMRNYLSYNRATPWDTNNCPSFVVDVRNTNSNGSTTGLVDATNVIIEFILPNGLEYEGHSTRGVGTAIYDPLTRKITWTIDKLPAGGIAFMNVFARIVKAGSLSTTARFVSVDQYNLGTAPTQAVRAITVSPASADIQVTQTVSNYTPGVNDTVTITITTRNNGPDDATGVLVTYLLPSNLTLISVDTHGKGTYNPTTGVWNINTQINEEIATLTIIAKVIETGTIKINATKTGITQYDWNFDNNAQNTYLKALPSADIAVTQSTNTTTPSWNDNVTLTINVTNNGPNTAHNVQVTSLLPAGLQWVSDNSSGAYDHLTGIWNIGTMTNGQSLILTIIAKVIGAGTINNTAAKTAETEFDPYPANDQQTVTLNVPVPSTNADVQVTQTASKTTLNTADPVTITITVRNNGPDQATGVQITDLLPTGLTYYSHTASVGSYSSSTGLWNIGTLTSGQSVTLTLTAIANALGDQINLVSKTAETEYDSNLSNDFQAITYLVNSNQVTNFTNPGQPGGTVNDDDGTTTQITLPFNVTLYGQTYNTIYINVNGLVSFGAPVTGPYYTQLPPSNIAYVAPFWNDIDVTYAGNISYIISDGQIIITWNQVPGYSEGTNPTLFNTFQLIITNDGRFGFIYGDMQWKNDPNDSYPAYARFNKGDSTTYSNLWTGTQDLSAIANQTFWFDSNGQLI